MADYMNHLPHLQTVANEDVAEIRRKEQTYQASWRRGGGVNAWHMARRKIDRLQTMLAPLTQSELQEMRELTSVDGDNSSAITVYRMATLLGRAADAEDIFRAMRADTSGADGSVLAEVRDLRRYLMLFEAGLMADMAAPPWHVDHVSVQEKGDTVHTMIEDTERRVPRSAPAEDSNRHAERVEPCGDCNGTKIIRTEHQGGGSSTMVCPVCR